MFGNLGMALAPLLAGLVNWAWGPRAVYIMLGAINVAGLALVRGDGNEVKPVEEIEGDRPVTDWRLAFSVLLVAMMLGGVAYRGSTVIIPAYFELKLQTIFQMLSGFLGGGVSRNLVATMITSIIFLVGMLGMYTGGRAAEKYDPRYCYLIFHLITVPAAILIAYLSETTLIVMVLVYFFFLLGMQPVENTLLAYMTPKRFHHTAFGAKFIMTFGVGALAVRMVGTIEKDYGIEPVFLALAGFSGALVLTILVLIGIMKSYKK
jgi:MFS family permease